MAKGLDDLIEFLLGEIAVSGHRGVSLSDIASFTSAFYGGNQDGETGDSPSDPQVAPHSDVAVDRALLSKIWTWLGRHPDISFGEQRKYNAVPLDDVEREYPDILTSDPQEDPEADSDDSHGGPEGSTSRSCVTARGPRIRITEERIYQAICGHPPDTSKVAPLEFDLLSHIAAARSNGILQGHLRQATGQDKRSVPKRTDALHRKGYIVKETVYRKGNRTSRLTLKRFADAAQQDAIGRGNTQHGSTVSDVVRRIFDILSEQNLVPQKTIENELSLNSTAEATVLLRVLRRLERLKCLRRVRSAVGPAATSGDLQAFVHLAHLPSQEDLDNFDSDGLSLDQSVQELASILEPTGQDEDAIDLLAETQDDTDAAHHVASWNPDRLLSNTLLDAVRLEGTAGMTNLGMRKMVSGLFVRRTIESLLQRVSYQSLSVQPAHLRHLAIVRIYHVQGGIAQWLHYSWDAFCRRVEETDIDVGQIPGAKEALEDIQRLGEGSSLDTSSAPTLETDQFGFPLGKPSTLPLNHGRISLSDLIRRADVQDVEPRKGEQVVVPDGAGGFFVKLRTDRPKPHRSSPKRQITQSRNAQDSMDRENGDAVTPNKPKGRPRKYLQGTEAFWRRLFRQAREDVTTDRSAAPRDKGAMEDPRGLALFTQRPPAFDETLVLALQAGLPVPESPEEVHDAWIASTRAILYRTSDGVYISRRGLLGDSAITRGQVMIVRTPRLASVDFSNRGETHPFRFLVSSAAHSFAFRRFYPGYQQNFDSSGRKSGRGKNTPKTPSRHRAKRPKIGPSLGLVHEDTNTSEQLPGGSRDEATPVNAVEGAIADYSEILQHVDQSEIAATHEARLDGVTREEVAGRKGTGPANDPGQHQELNSPQTPSIPEINESGRARGFEVVISRHDADPPPEDQGTPNVTKKRAYRGKRPREVSYGSDSPDTEYRPRKQVKDDKIQVTQDANILLRKIVLRLMSKTSGVAPSDGFTIRRVAIPEWLEARQEDRPLLKTVKSAVKKLCEQGKLKQHTFSFRGKSGLMTQRSIICLPSLKTTSPLVEEMKRKIVEMDPLDYVPPEWEAESSRVPLIGKVVADPAAESDADSPSVRQTARASPPLTEAALNAAETARNDDRASTPVSLPPAPASGFLTLKVHRLKSLAAVQLFNWRTEAPFQALRFETTIASPWKSNSTKRTTPGTRVRPPTTRRTGASIVWTNEQDTFPSSLLDILQVHDLKIRLDSVQAEDFEWQRFACEVEGVRAWEEQHADAFLAPRTRYAFINHVVPPALYADAVFSESCQFTALTSFDQEGAALERPFPEVESWPRFAVALASSPDQMWKIGTAEVPETVAPTLPPRAGMPRRRVRMSRIATLSNDDSVPNRRGGPRRGARISTLQRPRGRAGAGGTARTKVPRGGQHTRALPEETVYRVLVSVLVVRTLSGGVDGYIDWRLVRTLFPNEKDAVIRDCWRTLSDQDRGCIRSLTQDLQHKYLEALEADQVASVDFADLANTRWSAIVDWALKTLDRPASLDPNTLPGTRQEFVEQNAVSFSEPKAYYQLLSYNANLANWAREEVAGSIVFGDRSDAPNDGASADRRGILQYTPPYELAMQDPKLRLARSWVLSTILTPDTHIDLQEARDKLTHLAADPAELEELLNRALKLLQDEKLIQRVRDRQAERPPGVRAWEAHRRFYDRFDERRMITAKMLRSAARYKADVLDAALIDLGRMVIVKEQVMDDGEMVTVINLTANGRVTLRPGTDVPRTRYGLDHERVGYQSKSMDKALLRFSVELTATPHYVAGDPVAEARRRHPVPGRDARDVGGAHLPPWIDIHGNIQVALWEMFLVGAIGLVTQCPGISAQEISRALGFAVDQQEAAMLMDWCVGAGLAKLDALSHGYETLEWWWLCIATPPLHPMN